MTPIFIFTNEYDGKTSIDNDLDSYYNTKGLSLFRDKCPFCNIGCVTGQYETAIMDAPGEFQIDRLAICTHCGWWSCENDDPNPYDVYYDSSCAILIEFTVEGQDIPVQELARYLEKNPEKLKDIHPSKFEEFVGSLFSDYFGYKVEYCSYGRPDLGIDLVVINSENNRPIAIQVKRYNNPIELGQIHQFYGAMVDSKYQKGIFVTSGNFRSGASDTATRLNSRSNIEIDLVDGRKLLDFIKITNKSYHSVFNNVLTYLEASFKRPQLVHILNDLNSQR